MTRLRFKSAAVALAVVLLLVVSALLARGAAELLAYFQRAAVPVSPLNLVPDVPDAFQFDLAWLPDDADTGRVMEPLTRRQIEAAYLRAWWQLNLAYARGEPVGLKTYFVGPGLEAVRAAVGATGTAVEQVNLRHRLQLHFYSADGSIVSFTDRDARTAVALRDADGRPLLVQEHANAWDVVMFLEDGNWRIRHWRRAPIAGEPPDATAAPPPLPPFHGVNYYPQATPWHAFWPSYDPAVIDADLDRVVALGLDSVRIFVPYHGFGGATVDPARTAQLRDFLDRAHARGVGVIVTLFDFVGSYALADWPQHDRHLLTVLDAVSGHPALLAWDIKNEPDRDFAAHGEAVVLAWLAHALALAREHAPGDRLTIGWSQPEAGALLAADVDFLSIHYYGTADALPAAVAALREEAGNRPIALTEYGLPTWNSPFFPHGHSRAEQARYLADVLTAWRAAGGGGTLLWTLYDFSAVPADVAGRWPWQRGPQTALGVIDRRGAPKPAAAVLAPDADLDAVPRPAAWQRFVKPFWLTVGATGAGGLLLARAAWRRRARTVAQRPPPSLK